MSIARERCFHHAHREAVARCPGCGRYFCRECIGEHEGRVLCAHCLNRLGDKPKKAKRLTGVVRATLVLVGALLLWSSFCLLGRGLLTIPSSFHAPALQEERSPR
ncbi:MAG TPA: rhomboid family protein [Thermodesulfobacteriota bacterium]|nr:rhomboid family protein [Thermodesulfobacteriota bacterium]